MLTRALVDIALRSLKRRTQNKWWRHRLESWPIQIDATADVYADVCWNTRWLAPRQKCKAVERRRHQKMLLLNVVVQQCWRTSKPSFFNKLHNFKICKDDLMHTSVKAWIKCLHRACSILTEIPLWFVHDSWFTCDHWKSKWLRCKICISFKRRYVRANNLQDVFLKYDKLQNSRPTYSDPDNNYDNITVCPLCQHLQKIYKNLNDILHL